MNVNIDLISRSDDFGSVRLANEAILKAVRTGYVIRNVSCMAVGPYIEEGAWELKNYSNVCIGLHLTLNSEWDGIRWGALSKEAGKAGLTDKNGYFYHFTEELADSRPDLEAILCEYDAQLDRLAGLGLQVVYVDSHMAPEMKVPGLSEALDGWIRKKGLLDAVDFYHFPDSPLPDFADIGKTYLKNVEKWLSGLPDQEQFLYLTHPARKGAETLMLYNKKVSAGRIQLERDLEYQAVTSSRWKNWSEQFGLRFLKYTEAKKLEGGREQLRRIIGEQEK